MSLTLVLIESLLLVSVLRTALSTALPPGVVPCPQTENLDEYNKCVLEQLAIMKTFLPEGIASLKIPALEPLILPSLTIDRNLEALTVKANMTQVRVYGVSNYIIDELKANPKELSVELRLTIPHVHVKGEYDIQGRLLLLPLSGIGNFKGNFTDTQVRVIANGKDVTDKNNVEKVELDKINLKIRVGNGSIKLKAPPRHTLAADAAASFFNGNPRLVLDIVSPIIEETAITISKALVGRALGILTKEEILP